MEWYLVKALHKVDHREACSIRFEPPQDVTCPWDSQPCQPPCSQASSLSPTLQMGNHLGFQVFCTKNVPDLRILPADSRNVWVSIGILELYGVTSSWWRTIGILMGGISSLSAGVRFFLNTLSNILINLFLRSAYTFFSWSFSKSSSDIWANFIYIRH